MNVHSSQRYRILRLELSIRRNIAVWRTVRVQSERQRQRTVKTVRKKDVETER